MIEAAAVGVSGCDETYSAPTTIATVTAIAITIPSISIFVSVSVMAHFSCGVVAVI